MNGFERRKEQNREKILNAAGILFKQYDISKVSVSDIAGKAGVSKVTIYNLFPSKDALILSYIESITGKLTENLRRVIKTDKPYLDKLEAILHFTVEITESGPGLADTKIQSDPELSRLIDAVTEQQFELFLELIKEGKQEGYLNPDLSDEAVKTYFEIIIQGMKTNPGIHNKIYHNPKLFHDLLLLILHGFGKTR